MLSYLKEFKMYGHNDYAKSAFITHNVPIDAPCEMQKLLIMIQQLTMNQTIINSIGIGTHNDKRIHLLRSKTATAFPYKCRLKGINKCIASPNIKHLDNALLVTELTCKQLGFTEEEVR